MLPAFVVVTGGSLDLLIVRLLIRLGFSVGFLSVILFCTGCNSRILIYTLFLLRKKREKREKRIRGGCYL